MNISGKLASNFFLVLFSEKKSRTGMKSRAQFLRKKELILHAFRSFVRYKINLETDSMMRPIHIYLGVSKAYPKKPLV